MKKLMFALIAGVAVSAAQAVDVFAEGEGFEGAAVDAAATTLANFSYVPSSQSQDDSKVANEVGAFDGTRALYFSTNGVSNTKYLNLSTDGGVLYRSINAPENENPIGEARALTQSFYIDTLVQFTVCDSAPTIDSGAKLAIWLQASDDETTTNLMVQAKLWEVSADMGETAGFTSLGTTNLVLSGNYDAGAWYRLTVEAVPNLFTKANGRYATGFKVKINGSEVHATNGGSFVLASEQSSTLSALLGYHADGDMVTAMTSGSVFASIADTAANVDNSPSIAAVGFSGTGLVDEILFTDYNPDVKPVDVFDFTITLASGVSAVSYVISGSTNGTIGATTKFAALPVGTTVTLSRLTGSGVDAEAWAYKAAAVTDSANCTLDGLVATLDGNPQTRDASVTVGLATKTVETADEVSAAVAGLKLNNAIATYIGTDVEKYTAFTDWATGNSYDVERVNAYAYTLDRMTNNLPIAVSVAVSFDNEDVTNVDGITVTADADANAEGIDGAVDYENKAVYVTLDAGYGITVSGLTFASQKELESDPSAEGWSLNKMTVVPGVSNSARFVTTLDAGKNKADPSDYDASASIATKSSAPTTYDFTVTFASPVSGVSYVIGEAAAQSATSGVAIPVTVGSSITLTPAASSLDLPMFYTVTSDVTNYFTTLTFNAAGSVTIYAADASTAPADDPVAEAAATNAVAKAATAAGADGATVAAKVDAAANADGVSVASVATWLASKVDGSTVTYSQVAAAAADDLAAAVGFDLGEIVADPKVEITEVGDDTVNDGADAAYALTFKVTNQAGTQKDVGSAVADYVKGLVKMTSNLSDWDGSSKITDFDVEVSVNGDGTATAKVEKPAATTAFMKIGE